MLAKGAAIRVNVAVPALGAAPVIEAALQHQPDPVRYRRQREEYVPLQRLAPPKEAAVAVPLPLPPRNRLTSPGLS